jgi:hypothetical protein
MATGPLHGHTWPERPALLVRCQRRSKRVFPASPPLADAALSHAASAASSGRSSIRAAAADAQAPAAAELTLD